MSSLDQSRRAVDGQSPRGQPSSDELERWSRVKAVFLAALERPDSERSDFVAQACAGAADLQGEIESLLASDQAAVSFCETPAAGLLPAKLPTASTPRLPPGTRLGAYEISEFIAAGGMGEVYRARHSILGREVAIKTVGTQTSDSAARRRLIREARHASVLAHPNICAIHDVGDADDVPFIVMEYVHGRTLAEIVRDAVPAVQDALEYGIQIASALEHAHEHGIIHRDLKSSNVMIDAQGKAVVLDFGLARRLPGRSDGQTREPTLTRPNTLAGTLSYMAPEVLRGEPADARSDVWALGVLLYELVTGELPFAGRTQFETSSAILGEVHRPISGRVPLALRLVIERCLVKDPRGRYQSASAVREALAAIRRRRSWPVVGRLLVSARRRTLYTAAATVLVLSTLAVGAGRLRDELAARLAPRISALALLPLENATGDPTAEYYADGITDALIAQLGAASEARVLSRASTARAARGARTAADIGARLGADALVQGALRRSSGYVAVDVRLVRASDGVVVWTESYRRDARDVLALEADVVRGLAGAVQRTLRPGARERLATVRAVSPEVYEAYLKGRYEWNKRTQKSLQLAVEHFTRAVDLDPTYAPAHAALADCYNLLGTVMLGSGSPREFRPRAAAEAIKALQLDPSLAEAHATLGYVWHYQRRWLDAEREFRRAIELNPSYSLVRIWYANLLMSRLRMKEATEQVFIARDLDPFSLIVNTNVGWVLDEAGRHQDAIAHLRQTLALDSEYIQARWRLAGALARAGHYPEALDEANRVVILSDSALPALALVANISADAGKRDTARALLDAVLARSRRRYVPAGAVAGVFASLGDAQNALAWLEKAFDEGSNNIAYLAVDSDYASLRSDPRFQALLARAGLK
jgi:TolB-like protein/tetratricopeptide (TPR) repeat protein/predicted Ser/Thr protein kinase